jgi:hypothetical protein
LIKGNWRKRWLTKSIKPRKMGGQHGHKKAGPKKSHKSGLDSKYVKMPKLKKAPENPFDKFANSKKKHEVINRRVKGEDRNVGKARKNAIESRKNRLQQDYQSTKKTNSFADRYVNTACACDTILWELRRSSVMTLAGC